MLYLVSCTDYIRTSHIRTRLRQMTIRLMNFAWFSPYTQPHTSMVSFQSIQITYPIKQWAIQFVTLLNAAKLSLKSFHCVFSCNSRILTQSLCGAPSALRRSTYYSIHEFIYVHWTISCGTIHNQAVPCTQSKRTHIDDESGYDLGP